VREATPDFTEQERNKELDGDPDTILPHMKDKYA
jgi:hypothetical protein